MAETVFAPWTDPEAKPLIQFKGVTKRFGDFTAIDNLTLDIYAREFFALLGPSGCGKTTMMRMLAGFETPTEGQILLNGQDIGAVPPNKRAVNMMFQSYALFPHLTVWDNIAFGLRRETRDKDAINARVEEMLRLTRLTKFAKRKPHQISGGQRQRVALARSLAKAPKLLLLDEPLGALDRKLREETQFELMDIQEKTGTTFIIVTHDQEEAMTVASRVAVMDEGRIVQVATPDVIYEAPNSVYVADFIGDVNLIPGQAAVRETAPEAAEVVAEPAPEPTPAAASDPVPDTGKEAPQPNAFGIWLHDNMLKPILGERRAQAEPLKQLPPPAPEQIKAAPVPQDVPEGGVTITWAAGKAPLIAANGDTALAGEKVVLALRPEKVSISKERPDHPNILRGKVIDIAYLGNISTYHVEIEGGTMIKAQAANTRRLSRRGITWEDDVWLGFTATAGVVLKEDA
ncbi:ABC transporter ATP-binding protein [Tropicibacter naphthalenivorans]|uniref:Spermidine/putrescine import ATP-binding protein PotA n=1 Tax=Tropicibacter naphthalenivorans TaxID=441103 RepID=A0A0P1GVU2_9RHOB|nr:ABC transporter ATP-binding protein [Tropicibacter naphthalenivorans]CUH79894.1 Spermidine/putrescine import ATP-binding protein PotA [Tropicibacter naphthalenivorans]SMC75996.1 ABC-type Fe3+/spermidine/putrescine transport systems, ATPase components [Tropicibacter naphthalenivorans]